jgi:hypothetical protein
MNRDTLEVKMIDFGEHCNKTNDSLLKYKGKNKKHIFCFMMFLQLKFFLHTLKTDEDYVLPYIPWQEPLDVELNYLLKYIKSKKMLSDMYLSDPTLVTLRHYTRSYRNLYKIFRPLQNIPDE